MMRAQSRGLHPGARPTFARARRCGTGIKPPGCAGMSLADGSGASDAVAGSAAMTGTGAPLDLAFGVESPSDDVEGEAAVSVAGTVGACAASCPAPPQSHESIVEKFAGSPVSSCRVSCCTFPPALL